MRAQRLARVAALCGLFGSGALGCQPACPAPKSPSSRPSTSAIAAPAAPASTTVSTPRSALGDLNSDARSAYKRAKARALLAAGPVIVVENDSVVLLRDGKRQEARVVPPAYHQLKAIDHVALGVFAALAPASENLDASRLDELRSLRDAAALARRGLPGAGVSARASERSARILDASIAFLDATLSRHGASAEELRAYARPLGALLLENVSEAAHAGLDGLDAQLRAWRREFGDDEWRRVRAVVMGSHMARDGALALQYMLRVLGEDREGVRVVYAEGVAREEDALDLLATHIVDAAAADAFFVDPMRLHRDILADATKAYLETLAPAPL